MTLIFVRYMYYIPMRRDPQRLLEQSSARLHYRWPELCSAQPLCTHSNAAHIVAPVVPYPMAQQHSILKAQIAV